MYDASVAVAETLDTDYCKILELPSDGDEVFLRQGIGWQEGLVGNAIVPTGLDSQAGYTLLSEKPVIVDDLRTEKRFSGSDLLINHDVVSGISVIIGSVETPWGCWERTRLKSGRLRRMTLISSKTSRTCSRLRSIAWKKNDGCASASHNWRWRPRPHRSDCGRGIFRKTLLPQTSISRNRMI
ncbi:GAF domain-containing protein [Saliphagus sp. GCM10025308]